MADVSKLKIAVGSVEVVEGQPARNEAAVNAMVDRAIGAGADILVVPTSFEDAGKVRLIGLNDSRIDVAGNVVLLDACGESYRIALGSPVAGCDFTICADVSPFTLAARERGPLRSTILVRPVGMRERGHNVYAHDAGACVFGSDGSLVMCDEGHFDESFSVVSFEGAPVNGSRPDARTLLECIVATMRRFDSQVLPWKPKWVTGLSGGLDSSVVAALLALAVGPSRVVGYGLSTRFNSPETRANALSLAKKLGIDMKTGSIEDVVVSIGNALVDFGYPIDALKGIVFENVQARSRGNLLATFAALEGGVVVNNGNLLEGALGYATLYGDAIGALSPIGDLTKVQVIELAREINAAFGEEIVPANLLPVETEAGYAWDVLPSAELAGGQRDPMKWFYHDWLIEQLLGAGADAYEGLDEAACRLIERYADDKLLSSEVGKWVRYYGLDDPSSFMVDLEWVLTSMRASGFKRIQAPPKITVSGLCGFAELGTQVACEQSARYQALKAQLLGNAR